MVKKYQIISGILLLGGFLALAMLFYNPARAPKDPTPPQTNAQETPQDTSEQPTYEASEQALTQHSLPLDRIDLPAGFQIEVFATGIDGARSLTRSDNGILYVGSRDAGNVYALEDRDQDGVADRLDIIASGLNSPNGVAWKDGDLYVAEIGRILRFSNIDRNRHDPPSPEIIRNDYPDDPHHGWKFIAFGPDGNLFVPVGAPCNICESEDEIFGSITQLSPDGETREIIAQGIRNTVGFDWHPETNELWFTDNGRDWVSDNLPPDELNRLEEPGQHFGYPYCHGTDFEDPEFGYEGACEESTSPVQELGPHVAALGMRFYTGDQFPVEYQNQIFIAEHGSWNRTTPLGYRITLVRLDGKKATRYEPFATGWLNPDGSRWGRPVDLLVLPDGSLLISDDSASTIYRITYEHK